MGGLCAGCTIGGNTKAKLMDEREVEIGDRIRVLTSAGSWQTRTVDSVTYDNYQVTGFVVSEPYESETVSVGAEIGVTAATTDGKYTKAGHGIAIAANDFVQIDAASTTANNGVFKVTAKTNDDFTLEGTHSAISGTENVKVYKAHLATTMVLVRRKPPNVPV